MGGKCCYFNYWYVTDAILGDLLSEIYKYFFFILLKIKYLLMALKALLFFMYSPILLFPHYIEPKNVKEVPCSTNSFEIFLRL